MHAHAVRWRVLPLAARLRLSLQRAIALALAPMTAPAVVGILRFVLGYRIEGQREVRRRYREIRADGGAPLLICANHLTLIDSALIAWALGSPVWYVRHFSSLPWNVPDRRLFAATAPKRALVFVLKCLPIPRGGSRDEVAGVLARFAHLLAIGEVGLVFPEGGRSRTGRVEPDSAAYGVGRMVRAVPGCRVLCVYMKGERQRSSSDMPARRDRFRVALSLLEPKTDHTGLRASLDIAQQIVGRLAAMELEHLDDRQ